MGNAIANVTRQSYDLGGGVRGGVAPVGVSLIFSDNFASGDLTKTQNGFSWGSQENTLVTTANKYSGTHSLRFDLFSPALTESRFDLGALYDELTIRFKIYIPDGNEAWGGLAYDHYNVDGSSSNNKWLRLWDTNAYSGNLEKVGSSLGFSPDTGISSHYQEWNANDGSGMSWQSASSQEDNFITASDRGTWMTVEHYFKAASVADNDGIVRLYKNGSLLYEYTTVDNYSASGDHSWRYGYLLGALNGQLASSSHIYMFIDDIEFWDGAL